MPKLVSLTTIQDSTSFCYPRSITLESVSSSYNLTNRHTLSHHCGSWQRTCIQTQENRSYEEFLFLLLLISRHHSCSPTVSSVHCFFHTQFITSLLAVPSTENKSLHQDHRISNALRSSEIAAFHSHQTIGTLSLFRTLNLYPIRNTQIRILFPLSLPRRLYEMK